MKVTSPNKVLFPDIGLTKAELVAYYEQVGPAMIDAVADRPLTMHRFPQGLEDKGFLQKKAPDY